MSKLSEQALVSIITPSYNSEPFIEDTLKSVTAQTYQNWEMLIADDCSTDRTRDIVKQWMDRDNRIRLIELEENGGAAVARNTAINQAKGKYIAFLDSDDLWTPEKLEKQIKFMQERDIAFSFTGYQLMDVDGNLKNTVIQVPTQIDYYGLMKNTIIGCLTVIIDISKTGHFQMPNIRTRQDFALWLSILRKGFIAYGLQENLAHYRLVPGSISSNKVKAAKRTWKVYREIEGHGFIPSAWYFTNYAWNAVKKTYLK